MLANSFLGEIMAEINLTNKADIAGTYGDSASPITFSSNDVSTTIVQGFTVTKKADKTYWVDGPLTYTITITNGFRWNTHKWNFNGQN